VSRAPSRYGSSIDTNSHAVYRVSREKRYADVCDLERDNGRALKSSAIFISTFAGVRIFLD